MLCEKLSHGQQCIVPGKANYSFVLYNIALDLDANQGALFFLSKPKDQGKPQNQRQKRDQIKEILIASLSRVSGNRSSNISIQFAIGQQVSFKCIGGCIHIIGAFKKYNDENDKTSNKQKDIKNIVKNKEAIKLSRQKESRSSKQKEKQQAIKLQDSKSKANQQSSIVPQQAQSLRRSTRARAPAKPVQKVSARSAKRQNQQLKNMASYYQCNLDDDEDESFSQQQQQMDEEDDQSSEQSQFQEIIKNEGSGRKKRSKDSKDQNNQRNSNKSNQSERNEQTSVQGAQAQHFSVPTKNPYV